MKDNSYIPDSVRRELINSQKRENYYKQNIQPRLMEFSPEVENTIYNMEDTVEFALEKRDLWDALQKALSELTDKERKIIDDNFYFEGQKPPTQAQLAKAEGISSQVYGRKLKRILKKIKTLVELHMND